MLYQLRVIDFSLLPMGTGVGNRVASYAGRLFRAQLFHRTGRSAWRRSIVLLRQRSTSPRYTEPRGPGGHGDVLVVPLASPVLRLRLPIWLGDRFRTYMHVVFSLLWCYVTATYGNRVPSCKELTIYRIEAMLYFIRIKDHTSRSVVETS
jgi:hypothetical protein